jgi:hypothetical protein
VFASPPYRFEQRADMYARWDRQLRGKTRFFAAASVTNRVLGVLVRVTFPMRLSLSAGGVLDDLGRLLEDGNRTLAENVATERRGGVVLDEYMVNTEQSWVSRFLTQTAIAAPITMQRVTAELDGMLNKSMHWSICNLVPSVCAYLHVLRRVRCLVAAPLQFRHQSHRVHIGQQLLASIRGGAFISADPSKQQKMTAKSRVPSDAVLTDLALSQRTP